MSGGKQRLGDEFDARLTELWNAKLDDGRPKHSTAEIGRLMNKTRSAIIGRAHRLHLPSRGSPIRPGEVRKPKVVRLRPQVSHIDARASIPTPPRVVAPPVVHTASSRTCCYPLWGSTGRPTHQYCDAPSVCGSYCSEHWSLTHVRGSALVAEAA